MVRIWWYNAPPKSRPQPNEHLTESGKKRKTSGTDLQQFHEHE